MPERASWDQWTWTARYGRVTPLLFRLVDTVPTDLTDEQRADLRRLQGEVLSRCVQLEHHLLAACRGLADHGIRSVVLKGAATSHLDYPDPSWREYGDVDVLVDPADHRRGVALLEACGWARGYALPSGHGEFAHAVTLVRDGVELDLHQRIAHRALGLLVPTRELFARARSFEIAGTPLGALDDVDRLVHAAVHAVSSRVPYRVLSSVADVLLLADRRAGDATEVLARAERWRVRSLVERGVSVAYTVAAIAMPEAWIAAMRRPHRDGDRLVDRAYLGEARRPVAEELAYLRLLPAWDARWRYARGYFATGPDYTAQHGRSGARAQLRYVLAKLRARTPPT